MQQSQLIKELQDYAAARRISHGRLAQKLGVSPVTLNQWMNLHRKLRPDEVKRLDVFLHKPK